MQEHSTWTFAVVILGIAIAIGAGLNASYAASAQPTTVTNETITVEYTTAVGVDAPSYARSFATTHTVYNSTGAELTNGTDYTWQPVNGTVDWHNTSATASGETATITYTYRAPPATTRRIASLFIAFDRLLPLVILGAGVATVFWLVDAGGRF